MIDMARRFQPMKFSRVDLEAYDRYVKRVADSNSRRLKGDIKTPTLTLKEWFKQIRIF